MNHVLIRERYLAKIRPFYVKDFASRVDTVDNPSQTHEESKVKTHENHDSGFMKIRIQDSWKSGASNRDDTVAELLIEWKKAQEYSMEALGDEYQDYDLVFAGPIGLPTEATTMTDAFRKLIKNYDLPKVVFHSLRHSSITYKLKLNGGDVKAVQGDSGHAQASMVTEVYSHILDEDRQKNAELFEKNFYFGKGDEEPLRQKPKAEEGSVQPADVNTILKLLGNPETAGLLKALVSAMDK